MNEILSMLLFGVTVIFLVLGLSCIVMGVISNKTGAEALKERIEYGFIGFSGLTITSLLVIAG